MKKLLILFVFLTQISFGQDIRINDKEFFDIRVSIDPTSSIKEGGLDIVSEIEYVGPIYAKVGFESFSVLHGGYFDIHGAIGVNFATKFDTFRYYAGGRASRVSRGNSWSVDPGLEAGIDYKLSDNTFIGLRGTLDKRLDQKIFNWKPETKFSGFLTIGYRWDWHK